MLRADHHASQELAEHDKDSTKKGTLLRVKYFEEHTWNDSKQGEASQHEVKPVKDVVVDLVLLFDKIEVAENR